MLQIQELMMVSTSELKVAPQFRDVLFVNTGDFPCIHPKCTGWNRDEITYSVNILTYKGKIRRDIEAMS